MVRVGVSLGLIAVFVLDQSERRCHCEVLSPLEYAVPVQIALAADDDSPALVRDRRARLPVGSDQRPDHFRHGELPRLVLARILLMQVPALVDEGFERLVQIGTVLRDGDLVELAAVLQGDGSALHLVHLKRNRPA